MAALLFRIRLQYGSRLSFSSAIFSSFWVSSNEFWLSCGRNNENGKSLLSKQYLLWSCCFPIPVTFQLDSRDIPLPEDKLDLSEDDEFIRRKHNCTLFLGYTSNMASAGVRDVLRFLVQHNYVSIVTFHHKVYLKLVLISTLCYRLMQLLQQLVE